MFHPTFSRFAAPDAASLLADGAPENTPSPPLDRAAGRKQVGSKGMVKASSLTKGIAGGFYVGAESAAFLRCWHAANLMQALLTGLAQHRINRRARSGFNCADNLKSIPLI